MIVADTSAVLALLDADDAHHARVSEFYDDDWVLPWAILPEVSYLVARHLGADLERTFVDDLANGGWNVEAYDSRDVKRAAELMEQYSDLSFGLVDAVVMAIAERRRASIATFDLRHFGAVRLRRVRQILPRDL